MFKKTYQGSFFTIFHAIGSNPMQNWTEQVNEGHVERITDDIIKSSVWKIEGTNLSTTFITCPADPTKTLGIYLPVLVLIVKNLNQPFAFDIQVLDDTGLRRRFHLSTSCSSSQVTSIHSFMPLQLEAGWNKLVIDLSELTKRAYGINYAETLRVQIHANCCMRRVYFSDRLYSEDEVPPEYKLHLGQKHEAKKQKLEAAGPSK